jgi:cell wall-associated NlpC family hydrolase
MFDKWVGIPYKHLGRDKEGIDCWGLIVEIYKEKGIDVLDLDYEKDSRKRGDIFMLHYYQDWQEVKEAKMYDVILLENRDRDIASHAGVYISGGKFIHASKRGVIIDRLSRWQDKIIGIYRHKGIK